MSKKVIGICCGRSCCNRNKLLWSKVREVEREKDGKMDGVVIEEAMCLGMCEDGPNIRVDEDGVRRKESGVTEEDLEGVMTGVAE